MHFYYQQVIVQSEIFVLLVLEHHTDLIVMFITIKAFSSYAACGSNHLHELITHQCKVMDR